MSNYSSNTALLFVVEGLGGWDGADLHARAFSTHELTSALATALSAELGAGDCTIYPALEQYPNIARTKIGILDPISSDSGFVLQVSGTVFARSLLAFARGDYIEYLTTGGPATLASPVDSATTTLHLTDTSHLYADADLHIEQEAMTVSYVVDATHVVVTRGVLGTRAMAHSVPMEKHVVWDGLPSITGARIRIYELDDDATALPASPIYRGRIDSISGTDSASITLSISSLWAQMKATTYDTTLRTSNPNTSSGNLLSTPRRVLSVYDGGVGLPDTHSHVWVSQADRWADVQAVHMYEVDGDRWVCVEASEGATHTALDPQTGSETTYYSISISTSVIAWGDKTGLLSGDIPDDYSGMVYDLHYAILLDEPSDHNISAVVQGILTGTFPSGITSPPRAHAYYTVDEVDVSGFEIPGTEHLRNLTGLLLLLPERDVSIAEMLSTHILSPWGLALSVTTTGGIVGINWGADLIVDVTITEDELASDRYEDDIDQKQSLLSVEFPSRFIMRSYRSSAYYGGSGMKVKIEDGLLLGLADPEQVKSRWRKSLISVLEIAPRVVKLTLQGSTQAEVGDTVDVRLARLPLDTGAVDGVVIPSIGRLTEVTVDGRSGDRGVTINLYPEYARGAVWGASSEVNGNQSASTLNITVQSRAFTVTTDYHAHDPASFGDTITTSIYVQLFDQYLTKLSDNVVTVANIPDSTHVTINTAFTSSGVPLAINDGDVIMWMDENQQVSALHFTADASWVTDDGGELFTTSGEGRKYS